MRLPRMLSSCLVYSLLGSSCFALKLSPVKQQIRKVDISMESQHLQSAFKEAYRYLHSERLKLITYQNIDTDNVTLTLVTRKLKNSIDKWTILEEKLKSSVSVESLATYKQAIGDTNNNLAANKALLGQLLLMGKQEFLALQELQLGCPILWDYDVAIRNQYFDGWIDCYACLGYIHSKIGNLDMAAEIEEEMLSKMPWMRSAITSQNTLASAPTATLTRTTIEVSGPPVLKHLWSCSPIDRLSIADQTRRMWLTARILRAKLNNFTGKLLASSNKRQQLSVFMEAQEAVESELNVYTNRAASAAMVSDVVLGSANPPTVGTLDNLSQHDLVADIGEVRFSQILIKTWMADMIKDFKRQIYREASHYLKAMDRFVEDGAISLAADKQVSMDAQSENAPPGAMEEYFGAPLGFQSREAIRITFEYLFSEFTERSLQEGKGKVSSSRSGPVGSKTKAASHSEASPSFDGKSSQPKTYSRNTSEKRFRRTSRGKAQKSASKPTVSKSPNYANWMYASLISFIVFISGYVYWPKALFDAKNTATYLDREHTQSSAIYGNKSPHRKRGKDSKSTLNSSSLFAAESIDFDHVPFVSPYQMIRRVFTRASTAVERSLPVYIRKRCISNKLNQADTASEVRQFQCKSDHSMQSHSHQPAHAAELAVNADLNSITTRVLTNTEKRLSSDSRDESTSKFQQPSKSKSKKAAKCKSNDSTLKYKSAPSLPEVTIVPDCVTSSAVSPVPLVDQIDTINFEMETNIHSVVEACHRSSSPASSDGDVSHESHDSGETDHEVAGIDDKLVLAESLFDDILQNDDSRSSGDWIELSNSKSNKNSKMKKITEKSLSFDERREKAVQEYRLKQEIQRRFLDVAHSMPKARLPRNQFLLNSTASTKPKVVPPVPPLPTHLGGPSPVQLQPATVTAVSVVNSSAESMDAKSVKFCEESDNKSKCAKPHTSTKRFTNDLSFNSVKPVSTSVLNSTSKMTTYTTANTYKHKQPKPTEKGPSSPPKTVNYSINLTRADVEDGSVDSDCISSVTGDNQLSATIFADTVSQSQLQATVVHHLAQPIEIMSHYIPHTLVSQNDAYEIATNQNYVIMSQSTDGLVSYPMQMPMYQPAPVQISASTSHLIDTQMMPTQQSIQQQQQFYFYPQPMPTQTVQVPMAYDYQYYPQQIMPITQQQMRNTSRPHSVSPTLPNFPDGSQFSHVLDAVRQQIEYYFSVENLSRDVYLRGKLDVDGYVDLEEISQFRRIRQLRVTAHQIFEAIFSSCKLELQENSVVIAARSNSEVFASLPETVVLQTKVRTVEDRSLWNIPLAISSPNSPRVAVTEPNSPDRNVEKVESPHNFTPIQNVTVSYQRSVTAISTSTPTVTSSKSIVASINVDSSDVTNSQ